MRKIVFLLGLSLIFIACKREKSKTEAEVLDQSTPVSYNSYGEKISPENSLTNAEALERYTSLKPGDTLEIKFASKIKSVCKKKGCWMVVELPEQNDVRVTFKDYGFFVPKNIENTEVIVKGKAFLDEMSVEDQKHYAEDEGKSEAEIAAITSPKSSRAFIANAVLLKQ